ncbi:GPI transamidase component PIG-S [Linum perenne]
MAEISELPASTAPTLETSSKLDFDSKTMRTTKPGLKRLFLTFSVLIAFLLGFAFLWRTVEIYRSPLPFEEMEAISKEIESNHLQFPCHFQAVFHNFELRSSNYFKTNCSYQCGGIGGVNFGDDDEVVDEALRSVLNENSSAFGGKMYTLVVANGGALHHEPRATVGKYRHGWIVGKELEAEAATRRVVEMFVKVFINGGKDEGAIHGEFMPVGSDGKIVLSFSLLNSNPEDWIYDWDFQRIDETLLSPVIEALKPIADISVESQVLYYTPKSSFSHWDESLSSYVFSTKELPFFVNSNEWHLDTSVAAGGRSKILQFVVYILLSFLA